MPHKSHKDAPVGGFEISKILRLRRVIGESSILVKTDLYEAAEVAFQSILGNRKKLQKYVEERPEFLHALEPTTIEQPAPEVVMRMSGAADAAKVGPMAAVAGALADLAAEEMMKKGARVAVVENGGEVSVRSDVKLDVAVYSGDSSLSGRLGFRIIQEDLPLGLATSSGTVGHALSFGCADSATIIAEDAALADAAATAVCNAVSAKDPNKSIRRGLRVADSIQGVRGALIVRGNRVGTVGRLPRLISIGQLSNTGLQGPTFKDYPLTLLNSIL